MRTVLPPNPILVPENAKRVFKGIIYDTYHWQQQMYDGTIKTFEMLKRPDTIKVVAIVDEKVVVLRQEQPDKGVFYDIPGGRHDVETETELDAAKRELLEETGMTFANWKLIEVTQKHSKIEHFIYYFLAWKQIKQTEQSLDNGEKIEVQLMSINELRKLANSKDSRDLPVELFEDISTTNELIALPDYPSA